MYGVFYDAVSISDYNSEKQDHCWMKIWKECEARLSWYNHGTLHKLTYKEVSKTTQKLQDSSGPGRDSNWATSEQKSRPLLLHHCAWYGCYTYLKLVYKLQFWNPIDEILHLIQFKIICKVAHKLTCMASPLNSIK